MSEMTPFDISMLRHLEREVQYYLHIDMQTGDKPVDIKQNLERSRQEVKRFIRQLREEGKDVRTPNI